MGKLEQKCLDFRNIGDGRNVFMSSSSDSRKEYQRMYYEINREKISERKKERYQKDSKVRERAKELSRLNVLFILLLMAKSVLVFQLMI
ncbi:MAG: hypothetical protein P8Y23_00425 [Candidatus Lokiarchaeota archaeon]